MKSSPLMNKQLHSRLIEVFLLSGRVNRAYCSPGSWLMNLSIVVCLWLRGFWNLLEWYGHSVPRPSMRYSLWEVEEGRARCLLAPSIPLFWALRDISKGFCFFDWFSPPVGSRGCWLLMISKIVSSRTESDVEAELNARFGSVIGTRHSRDWMVFR